jgi:hypothetical protein
MAISGLPRMLRTFLLVAFEAVFRIGDTAGRTN